MAGRYSAIATVSVSLKPLAIFRAGPLLKGNSLTFSGSSLMSRIVRSRPSSLTKAGSQLDLGDFEKMKRVPVDMELRIGKKKGRGRRKEERKSGEEEICHK